MHKVNTQNVKKLLTHVDFEHFLMHVHFMHFMIVIDYQLWISSLQYNKLLFSFTSYGEMSMTMAIGSS
jgi:hypothetical protein